MDTAFETSLNKIQLDMVSTCMDYCQQQCDHLYVHIIYEKNILFADFYFRINGQMCKKSRIDSSGKTVDPKKQKKALSDIIAYAREIFKLCEAHNRPVPTELRLFFDNHTNNFRAKYCYDEITNEARTDRTVSNEWFSQLSEVH